MAFRSNFLKKNQVLLFVVIFTILTVLIVPKYVNADSREYVADPCRDVIVKINIEDLRNIENCTVIKGYLQIALISNVKAEDFYKYSLPKLREITGYLFIYRISGLNSLGVLLPNLIVIRGTTLMTHFALVIAACDDLHDVGLKSLIAIQRGYVNVTSPSLCFANTIVWKNITYRSSANFIRQADQNSCPSTLSCRGCEPQNCWNIKYCQRSDTPYNYTGDIICHPQCLGSCYNTSDSGCFTCRNVTRDDGVCIERCDYPRVLSFEDLRCITKKACYETGRLIFNDQCIVECPLGFTLKVDKETSTKVCIACEDNCQKTCRGIEINYLSEAQQLIGCTIIDGSLHIKLNTDTPNLIEELEKCLGEIEVIQGFLKIYRSVSITSLSFLRNLRLITGEQLEFDRFGFVVYENPNLQTLFNWNLKKNFTILKGGFFFHFNYKLCLSEIQILQKITTYFNKEDFICNKTNGYEHQCDFIEIYSRYSVLSANTVTIYWQEYQPKNSNQTVLGYLISHIPTTRSDLTSQFGTDACSKFSWHTELVLQHKLVLKQKSFSYNITNLQPLTRYGYYVKSFTIDRETADVVDSESQIKYFKTMSAPPSLPIVATQSKTSDSLTIRWVIDEQEVHLIDYFKIDVYYRRDDIVELENRDFCTDPIKNEFQDLSSLEPLPCCIKSEDEQRYEELYELVANFRAGTPHLCVGHPKTECYLIPQSRVNIHQPDAFYKYDNYFHNIDYPFRKRLFDVAGLKNLQSDFNLNDYDSDRHQKIKVHSYKREFMLTKLLPFSRYTIVMVACNTECSPYYMHTDRTAPLPKGDEIDFEMKNTTDELSLYFIAPKTPNILTVAFHVEVMKLSDNPSEGVLCVSKKIHERRNNTFIFNKLPAGKYAIRVCSISLAGICHYSDWKIIDIEYLITSSKLTITLVSILVVAALITFAIVIFIFYRKRTISISSSDQIGLVASSYIPHREEISWRLMGSEINLDHHISQINDRPGSQNSETDDIKGEKTKEIRRRNTNKSKTSEEGDIVKKEVVDDIVKVLENNIKFRPVSLLISDKEASELKDSFSNEIAETSFS